MGDDARLLRNAHWLVNKIGQKKRRGRKKN
jgi:hypothetical protein